MARLNVNPTKMVLTGLKRKLTIARRGHKLLKDKRDELMKQFIEIMHETKVKRETVEASLEVMYRYFLDAKSSMGAADLDQALEIGSEQMSLDLHNRNIMSVLVPEYTLKQGDEEREFLYSLLSTPGDFDGAIAQLKKVVPEMLDLAQKEKTIELMADELEKTRRRVNALEFVTIPQHTETIKYITMKLDENERGSRTRLMKLKDMMMEEKFAQKEA